MGVSRVTASKWWHRCEDGGGAGLGDRLSRPRHCPGALEARWVEEVEGMRRAHTWSGPDQLPDSGSAVGWATRPRIVGRWLERLGISRRRNLDPTGGPDRVPGVIRARYRVHMDVKKVGHPHGGRVAHSRAGHRRGQGLQAGRAPSGLRLPAFRDRRVLPPGPSPAKSNDGTDWTNDLPTTTATDPTLPRWATRPLAVSSPP